MPQDKTTKGWETVTFRCGLTNRPRAVEILPVDDLEEHISSESCPCIPKLEWKKDQCWKDAISILIHNSYDGREVYAETRGH